MINLNALKISAIILAIIGVCVVVIYLLGQFEQTRPINEQIMGYVNTAKDYVTSNWTLVAGSIGTVTALGGVAYSKLSAAKQQITQATTAASTLQTANEKLEGQVTQYETQIEGYKQQITDLKNQAPVENTDKILALEKQVKTAQDNLSFLESQNASFVKQMMAASNGALVTNPVDGRTYSVLKLPPEKIVV